MNVTFDDENVSLCRPLSLASDGLILIRVVPPVSSFYGGELENYDPIPEYSTFQRVFLSVASKIPSSKCLNCCGGHRGVISVLHRVFDVDNSEHISTQSVLLMFAS
jgi:hypothetical protein